MINKKQSSKLLHTILVTVVCSLWILSITVIIYYILSFAFKNSYNNVKEHFIKNTVPSTTQAPTTTKPYINPLDYFTCTMNLTNIAPNYVNNYMTYDSKSVSCGPCKGATLKMNITTCPVDANGNASSSCKPTALITSSLGNPILFPFEINSKNLTNFFCI